MKVGNMQMTVESCLLELFSWFSIYTENLLSLTSPANKHETISEKKRLTANPQPVVLLPKPTLFRDTC